jgi:hypothetical protein
MSGRCDNDELTAVYLLAKAEGRDDIRELRVEIERLREAIRFAVEAIDGDDVISASEHLRAALGEEK